jgi:hypothetical protein
MFLNDPPREPSWYLRDQRWSAGPILLSVPMSRNDKAMPVWHGITICSVQRGEKIVIAGTSYGAALAPVSIFRTPSHRLSAFRAGASYRRAKRGQTTSNPPIATLAETNPLT